MFKKSNSVSAANSFTVTVRIVGVEHEGLEVPFLAGLDGLDVGGDGGSGDDAAAGILEVKFHFHAEISVLGNILTLKNTSKSKKQIGNRKGLLLG